MGPMDNGSVQWTDSNKGQCCVSWCFDAVETPSLRGMKVVQEEEHFLSWLYRYIEDDRQISDPDNE